MRGWVLRIQATANCRGTEAAHMRVSSSSRDGCGGLLHTIQKQVLDPAGHHSRYVMPGIFGDRDSRPVQRTVYACGVPAVKRQSIPVVVVFPPIASIHPP